MRANTWNIIWKSIFILTLCLRLVSCESQNVNKIKKFIYLKVRPNVIMDNLGKPQISLEEYLEYSADEDIKIAKSCSFANRKPYDLNDFQEDNNTDSLKLFLDNAFSVNSFGNTYLKKGEDPFFVFIIQTTKGKQTIIYKDTQLPLKLKLLHNYISHMFKFEYFKKVDYFNTDDFLVEFEKQLFKRNPPPIINEFDIPDPNN